MKHAFADLLDHYIHAKARFPNEFETAEAVEAFLKKSKQDTSHLRFVSSETVKVSHTVLHRDGKPILCEEYAFDTLGAFLYLDFFAGLRSGYVPKRCQNCGQYFLLTGGKYSGYCERPLPDDKFKTCRDVGARKKYDDKCKTDPVWLTYNRAYKAHYARAI